MGSSLSACRVMTVFVVLKVLAGCGATKPDCISHPNYPHVCLSPNTIVTIGKEIAPLLIDGLTAFAESAKFQFWPQGPPEGSDVNQDASTTEYDIIFEFKDLDSLMKKGFDISVANHVIEQLKKEDPEATSWVALNQKYFKGGIIVVVGRYNGGKTWFFNRLANIQLENGVDKTTVGFSFKLITSEKGYPLILVDTLGHDNPTPQFTTEAVAKRRVQEVTIKHVARDIADVRIMVVGQISSSDQLELIALAEELKTTNTFQGQGSSGGEIYEGERAKPFFVLVHNVRMDIFNFNKYFTAHIDKSFPERSCVRLLHDTDVKSLLGNDYVGICGEYAAGEFIMESSLDGINILHYFMLNETMDGTSGRERVVNDIMVADLLNRIRTKVGTVKFEKPRPILSRSLESMQQSLRPNLVCDHTSTTEAANMNACSTSGLQLVLKNPNTANYPSKEKSATTSSLHVELESRYALRDDIARNVVPKLLTPAVPEMVMTVYQMHTTKTHKSNVGGKAFAVKVHAQTIFEIEMASLNSKSSIDLYLENSNMLVLKFYKPLNHLKCSEKERCELLFNNRKGGLVERALPLPPTMSTHDEAIEYCVEDGIMRIIVNNGQVQENSRLTCQKLATFQLPSPPKFSDADLEECAKAEAEAAENKDTKVPDKCVHLVGATLGNEPDANSHNQSGMEIQNPRGWGLYDMALRLNDRMGGRFNWFFDTNLQDIAQ